MPNNATVIHEESYKGLRGFVHRNRLAHLQRIIRGLNLSATGLLADFGCSNGFIIESIEHLLPGWTFHGYDRSEGLLQLARKKDISNATFWSIDLNRDTVPDRYDLVLCLETLEHVGDYRAAMECVYGACKRGGSIVVSVPKETGLQGLVKLIGRHIIYRKPYGTFFQRSSELRYAVDLVTGRRIDRYRGLAEGWGTHLGFDSDVFDQFVKAYYSAKGTLQRKTTMAGFNVFYVLRKH